jgi:hypothetical protein
MTSSAMPQEYREIENAWTAAALATGKALKSHSIVFLLADGGGWRTPAPWCRTGRKLPSWPMGRCGFPVRPIWPSNRMSHCGIAWAAVLSRDRRAITETAGHWHCRHLAQYLGLERARERLLGQGDVHRPFRYRQIKFHAPLQALYQFGQ